MSEKKIKTKNFKNEKNFQSKIEFEHLTLLEREKKFFDLFRKDYESFLTIGKKDINALSKKGFYMLKKDYIIKEIEDKKKNENYKFEKVKKNFVSKLAIIKKKSKSQEKQEVENFNKKYNNIKINEYEFSNSNEADFYASDGFVKNTSYPVEFYSKEKLQNNPKPQTAYFNDNYKVLKKRTISNIPNNFIAENNLINKLDKTKAFASAAAKSKDILYKIPNKLIYFKKPELIHEYLLNKENNKINEAEKNELNVEDNAVNNLRRNRRSFSFKKYTEDIINIKNERYSNSATGFKYRGIHSKNKSLDLIIEKNLSKKDLEKYNLQRKLSRKSNVSINDFIYGNFKSNESKQKKDKKNIIKEMISVRNFSNLQILPKTSNNPRKRVLISFNGNEQKKALIYPKTADYKTISGNEKTHTSHIKRFFSSDAYFLSPGNICNMSDEEDDSDNGKNDFDNNDTNSSKLKFFWKLI